MSPHPVSVAKEWTRGSLSGRSTFCCLVLNDIGSQSCIIIEIQSLYISWIKNKIVIIYLYYANIISQRFADISLVNPVFLNSVWFSSSDVICASVNMSDIRYQILQAMGSCDDMPDAYDGSSAYYQIIIFTYRNLIWMVFDCGAFTPNDAYFFTGCQNYPWNREIIKITVEKRSLLDLFLTYQWGVKDKKF